MDNFDSSFKKQQHEFDLKKNVFANFTEPPEPGSQAEIGDLVWWREVKFLEVRIEEKKLEGKFMKSERFFFDDERSKTLNSGAGVNFFWNKIFNERMVR